MDITSTSTSTITKSYSTQQTTKINEPAKEGTKIQSKTPGWVSQTSIREKLLAEKYKKNNDENKQFEDPLKHIWEKYYISNSPYYIQDMTQGERDSAVLEENSWFLTGGCSQYSMQDSLFHNDPINAWQEDANEKVFFRQNVNNQLKHIFENSKITIPSDTNLTFTIDPNDYKLTVSGTEDKKLIGTIEEALNSPSNVKELFYHIIRSKFDYSDQYTREKSSKYELAESIKTHTGHNLKDLAVVDGKFITEDGRDILGLFKDSLNKDPAAKPYLNELVSFYGSQLSTLAKNGYDSVPDLILSIDYKNGSLHDIGQKSYGTGGTDWISKLSASLTTPNPESLNKDIAHPIKIDLPDKVSTKSLHKKQRIIQ